MHCILGSLLLAIPLPALAGGPVDPPFLVRLDVEGDGILETYLLRLGFADVLLRTLEDGGFLEASAAAGLGGNASRAALAGDVDGDGRDDLFTLTSEGAPRLFRNAGDGTFFDATRESGLGAALLREAPFQRAAWVDLDGDPRLDLALSADAAVLVLLRGGEGGTFQPLALAPARPLPSSATAPPPAVPVGAEEPGADPRPEPRSALPSAPGGVERASRQPLDPTPAGDARTTAAPSGGTPLGRFAPALACAAALADDSGGCIGASSIPRLGRLYPLSANLFVDDGTGFLGLGTTSPLARLDVVGDALLQGRLFLGTDTQGLLFPPASGTTAPMVTMFTSGTANADRMVLGHSPAFPTWGLEYEDATDRFSFQRAATDKVVEVDLALRELVLHQTKQRLANASGLTTVELDPNANGNGRVSVRNGSGAVKIDLDGGQVDGGGSLTLRATDGSTTVFLDGNDANDGGRIEVRNDLSAATVHLIGDDGDQSGKIELIDRTGTPVKTLELDAELFGGSGLQLFSPQGVRMARLSIDSVFGGYLSCLALYNQFGQVTAFITGLGQKNAVVQTEHFGQRLLYCVESTEVWFEDQGRARLTNGVAHVALDPIFLETVTIDEAHPLQVQVTATGPALLWVQKERDGFVVRSLGGDDAAGFDWRVSAKRLGPLGDARLEPYEATDER